MIERSAGHGNSLIGLRPKVLSLIGEQDGAEFVPLDSAALVPGS